MSAYEVIATGSDTVVHVTGEIDVSNVAQLTDSLLHAETQGSGRMIVDLTGTSFIDSSGISAISRLQKRMDQSGRSAALVCPDDNLEVSKVLRIMGVGAAMPIYQRLDEVNS